MACRSILARYGRPDGVMVTGAGLIGLLVLTTMIAGAKSPPSGPKPVLAPRQFKNIKVLTTLPADQLINVMRGYNASLGVRCDFCHVVGANHQGFERDVKPEKSTARKMIQMMNRINQHEPILGKKASCYLCHHGHAQPETTAPAESFPGRR